MSNHASNTNTRQSISKQLKQQQQQQQQATSNWKQEEATGRRWRKTSKELTPIERAIALPIKLFLEFTLSLLLLNALLALLLMQCCSCYSSNHCCCCLFRAKLFVCP
jgi:hypothetical protein